MEVESCLTAFNSGNTDESEFWREVSGERVLTEVGDSEDIADQSTPELIGRRVGKLPELTDSFFS